MTRSPDLRELVQHPKVTAGKWVSEYHKPLEASASPWRVASDLPIQYVFRNGQTELKYTLYTDMVADMFSHLTDFHLEAWRERRTSKASADIDLRMFDLVYESKGSSPQEVPWWGPSRIDLKRVFSRNAFTHEKVSYPYTKDPWTENTRKDQRYTNVWFYEPIAAPFPIGMTTRPKELVHIIGSPFYFYEPGKWDKPAGSDPYRLHLTVGVGRYLPGPEYWRVMSTMFNQGILEPRDVQQWIKAAGR